MQIELTNEEIERILQAGGRKQIRNTDSHIRKLMAERERLLDYISVLEDELNKQSKPKHKPTEYKS